MERKRYSLPVREQRHIALVLAIPDIVIDIKTTIKPEILKEALKETLSYFPLFKGRFVFDKNLFVLEENTLEPLIFPADQCPKNYGTEETNFFPWIICYREKSIIAKVSHAITDGMGAFSFVTALLHIYLEKCGVHFSEASKTDLPQDTIEHLTENPDECYSDENVKPIGYPKFRPLIKLDEDLFTHNVTTDQAWRIRLKKDEIEELTASNETSKSSAIAFFLGRAFARTFGLESGDIEVRVPVNFRPHFGSSTQHNFAQSASLRYRCEKMNDMDREKIQTAFRSQLDIYFYKDNMTNLLNLNMEAINRLKQDRSLYENFITEAFPETPVSSIVYSHMSADGFSKELLSYITDIRIEHPYTYWKMMVVFVLSFGEEISLFVHHQMKDNLLVKELEKVLKENGVHYTTEQLKLGEAVLLKDVCGYMEKIYG